MSSLRVQQMFPYILQERGECYKWTLQGTRWIYTLQCVQYTETIINWNCNNCNNCNNYVGIPCLQNLLLVLHIIEKYSARSKVSYTFSKTIAEIMPRAGRDHAEGWHASSNFNQKNTWSLVYSAKGYTEAAQRQPVSKTIAKIWLFHFHLVSSRQSAVLKQILRNKWSDWESLQNQIPVPPTPFATHQLN